MLGLQERAAQAFPGTVRPPLLLLLSDQHPQVRRGACTCAPGLSLRAEARAHDSVKSGTGEAGLPGNWALRPRGATDTLIPAASCGSRGRRGGRREPRCLQGRGSRGRRVRVVPPAQRSSARSLCASSRGDEGRAGRREHSGDCAWPETPAPSASCDGRPSPLLASSGPQNCAACVHEGIYEEGVSILESGSVSEKSSRKKHQSEQKMFWCFSNTPEGRVVPEPLGCGPPSHGHVQSWERPRQRRLGPGPRPGSLAVRWRGRRRASGRRRPDPRNAFLRPSQTTLRAGRWRACRLSVPVTAAPGRGPLKSMR